MPHVIRKEKGQSLIYHQAQLTDMDGGCKVMEEHFASSSWRRLKKENNLFYSKYFNLFPLLELSQE